VYRLIPQRKNVKNKKEGEENGDGGPFGGTVWRALEGGRAEYGYLKHLSWDVGGGTAENQNNLSRTNPVALDTAGEKHGKGGRSFVGGGKHLEWNWDAGYSLQFWQTKKKEERMMCLTRRKAVQRAFVNVPGR